jgi:soluble lytic murein transglycosylase-like protein
MKYGLSSVCLALLWGASSAWAAPARNAARNAGLDDALVITQKVEQQLKKKPVLSETYARMMLKALQSDPQHPLRAYWVYALAHSGTPAEQVRSALTPRDPLQAHFYWWRAMRQNTSHAAGQAACARDFGAYTKVLKTLPPSTPLPRIPDSRDLQAKAPCLDLLSGAQGEAVARVVADHDYFWLLPRVLKKASTPEGLFLQGKNRLVLRQYAQAAQSFVKVLQHPKASGKLKKQAAIQAGVAELSRKRTRQAAAWWQWISPQDRTFYPEVLWHQGKGELLLQRYPEHPYVPEILAERLDKAVIAQNASQIKQWSQALVTRFPRHEASHQARYWLGRVLEKQGKQAQARALFRTQSQQAINNYYTQLSRCRLKGTDCFRMIDTPLTARAPDFAFLHQQPALKTILAQKNNEILEVIAPFVVMDPQERALLTAYAYRHNGHYFRSIRSIWQQQTRDINTLRLMYPLHYDTLQKENAERYQLPQALIAGITWQESMYKADIRSVSGARGLMQLMPRTAQYIAPKAGLAGLSLSQLDQPRVNIRLGSYYLRAQADSTGGNIMKMAASYNGGPNAVARWVKAFGPIDDDVFVERIPYAETRRYAKQVTMHTRVYSQIYGEKQ